MFFNKQATCVVGPNDPIHLPRASRALDYEGELGFVIGRRCRHVPRDRAHEVIAGYLIVDDVSVRDWQMRAPTMTLGKSFDTHGPIGPWIVTPDEIGDPGALEITLQRNGVEKQHSNTAKMIFPVARLIAELSKGMTLLPGDVIATGTPEGVGFARNPPEFLTDGDMLDVWIEKIGHLTNTVIIA
jgi:2-keto-4-pentenoate hydratase/2-oxohepta-3-ene-1,7-dioic acid hydratase in catechol pathway